MIRYLNDRLVAARLICIRGDNYYMDLIIHNGRGIEEEGRMISNGRGMEEEGRMISKEYSNT